MKIGGVTVSKCEELVVLPRPGGDDIPFRAKAVSINKEFEALVPVPVAPMLQTKEGNKPDYSDKTYKDAVARRGAQRFAFMCLKSLEPSDIEWETVDLEKPGTWIKWTDELMDSGISDIECGIIVNTVMSANALDEDKINEARKRFLLGQGE